MAECTSFSSTTKSLKVLSNPMFCGTTGERTQFMIEASSGVRASSKGQTGPVQ